jgi:Fe-S cluster assembly iron-binding protein IscA
VLALTDNATDAIERILAAPGVPMGAGIRIAPGTAVSDGGAATNELQLSVAEEPAVGDDVIEEHGARVFVEDTVSDYLDDKQLDAEVVDERVRFSLAG